MRSGAATRPCSPTGRSPIGSTRVSTTSRWRFGRRQKMVRSDLAAAGVIFSIDTETGFQDVVFITGAWGLGENVVQGAVDADEFYVHKPTFRQGYRAVLRRTLGAKKIKMVYAEAAARASRNVNEPTSKDERERFCITDDEVLTLADYALKIEDHYSRRGGHFTPWTSSGRTDGLDGELYIVQARPETVASQRNATRARGVSRHRPGQGSGRGPRGRRPRCASGQVRVIKDAHRPVRVPPGRGAGRRHHDARLGAGDEDRGRDRHQPRRAHLPCRDRGARARHPGGGRHRPTRTRRSRPARRSRSPAPRATSAGSTRARSPSRSRRTDLSAARAAADPDHDQPRQPRARVPDELHPQRRRRAWPGMEFIINEYIKAHPMALLHPEKIDGRRPSARRSRG